MPGQFETLRSANAARHIEWVGDKAQPSFLFRGVELAGEVGEALNVLKKIERQKMGYPGSRATMGDLARELADIIICVDLLAMDLKIDLWPMIVYKFNETSKKVGLETKIIAKETF